MNDILTMAQVIALADIGHAAERTAKVARALDDGRVIYGTARSVGDENGCTAWGVDVREQFLRVTTQQGLEAFWPVRDLMAEHARGEFAEYDW